MGWPGPGQFEAAHEHFLGGWIEPRGDMVEQKLDSLFRDLVDKVVLPPSAGQPDIIVLSQRACPDVKVADPARAVTAVEEYGLFRFRILEECGRGFNCRSIEHAI
ncbi:MAG: hypothetical protein DMF80_04770 [Acidobacteria bacterium]|nr:MAG: hypothetical protein DMF80_04770 [Acidobacteriota bacterium]